MVRVGCCLNMFNSGLDRTGIRYAQLLRQLQFDYVELPLAQVMELDDPGFDRLLRTLESSGIPCEACNNFLPGSVRVTGEDVSANNIRAYLQKALERAAALGSKIIVFGSSGARNLDRGFSREHAFEQLVEFLQIVSDMITPYGINIAIENLNKTECNIINTVGEAAVLAEATGRQNIRLLADYYHMEMESESAEVIPELHKKGFVFEHTHIADMRAQRGLPFDAAIFAPFAEALRSIGYDGRISIEGNSDRIEEEAAESLNMLTRLFRAD